MSDELEKLRLEFSRLGLDHGLAALEMELH